MYATSKATHGTSTYQGLTKEEWQVKQPKEHSFEVLCRKEEKEKAKKLSMFVFWIFQFETSFGEW